MYSKIFGGIKMNEKVFEPMTLTNLLLLFHKAHLNLINYEKKPPDNHQHLKQPDRGGKVGDPVSR